jgi:hypothetical protein
MHLEEIHAFVARPFMLASSAITVVVPSCDMLAVPLPSSDRLNTASHLHPSHRGFLKSWNSSRRRNMECIFARISRGTFCPSQCFPWQVLPVFPTFQPPSCFMCSRSGAISTSCSWVNLPVRTTHQGDHSIEDVCHEYHVCVCVCVIR